MVCFSHRPSSTITAGCARRPLYALTTNFPHDVVSRACLARTTWKAVLGTKITTNSTSLTRFWRPSRKLASAFFPAFNASCYANLVLYHYFFCVDHEEAVNGALVCLKNLLLSKLPRVSQFLLKICISENQTCVDLPVKASITNPLMSVAISAY